MDEVKIAKFMMKKFAAFPTSPQIEVGQLQEVFLHSIFLNGSQSERQFIMRKSSESSYSSETSYAWDHYFGQDLSPFLSGKTVLDLGCFNGGRSVAWFEKYKLNYLVGIDIDQVYLEAATQFSSSRKIRSDFASANGGFLPFGDGTFDAILSFEVFEHVQDIQRTLTECYRVLKTDGRLYIVFPGYFHPNAHHLSLVTTAPCLNSLFSGKILVQAYYDILTERGSEAFWYRRHSPKLEPWEKSNTINGTTSARFRRLLRNNNWKIILHSRKPIGSIGRNASKSRLLVLLSSLFYPLTFIIFLQEFFLHRITYVLEKKNSA